MPSDAPALVDFLSLGVMVTARCPWECAHCFTLSSPKREKDIDVDLAARTIEALLPYVRGVSLSGGEPLLVPDVVEALARAVDGRRPVHVVTNGYWHTRGEGVLPVLERLRAAGVRMANLSFDVWHSPWIDLDGIVAAASLLRRARVHPVVHLVGEPGDALTEAARRRLAEEGIDYFGVRLSSTGRGETLPTEAFAGGWGEGGCRLIRVMSLDERGILRACCGPSYGCGPSTAFHLADAAEDDVVSAVERARFDPVLAAVGVYGPGALARLCDPPRDGVPARPTRTPCDACVSTLGDPARVARLREILGAREHRRRLVAGNLLAIETLHRRYDARMRELGYAIA